MQLNGEETEGADEEARKNGWVEDVAEEPLSVDVLRRGEVKKSGYFVGKSHEKRMSSDSMEGEEVMVRELDTGSRMGGGMVIDSGIRVPSLASVLEVVLEAAPLVPLQRAVR